MTDPKTRWPPRGFIFTTRSHSAIGRAIVMGQRLRAWFPAQGHDEFSHAGIVDAYPMVWEAHARWGVIRRVIGRRSHLRFWHPPHEERLTPEDYARAFEVLAAHLGRPYARPFRTPGQRHLHRVGENLSGRTHAQHRRMGRHEPPAIRPQSHHYLPERSQHRPGRKINTSDSP